MNKYDALYVDWVLRLELQSHAEPERRRVGCLITRDDNVLAYGWNGTPRGFDNCCESHKLVNDNGVLRLKSCTKPEVSHAEPNALGKLAASGTSAAGSTMYVSLAPCIECAKLVQQARVKEVVYLRDYKNDLGLSLLNRCSILTRKYYG